MIHYSNMTENPTREDMIKVAEEIRPSIMKVAEVKGWGVNDNKDIVDSILEGLARNKIIHNKRFCPCRIWTGDETKDRDFFCPCKSSTADVEKDGHCHCYLYIKK